MEVLHISLSRCWEEREKKQALQEGRAGGTWGNGSESFGGGGEGGTGDETDVHIGTPLEHFGGKKQVRCLQLPSLLSTIHFMHLIQRPCYR